MKAADALRPETMRKLIAGIAIALGAGGLWAVSRDNGREVSTGSSGIIVVSGSNQRASTPVERRQPPRNALTGDSINSSSPRNLAGLKAQILGEQKDSVWAAEAELQMSEVAERASGLTKFHVECRSSGCVMSGLVTLSDDGNQSKSEMGAVIDSSSMLKASDASGDKFLSYKIVTLQPPIMSFEAIAFRK